MPSEFYGLPFPGVVLNSLDSLAKANPKKYKPPSPPEGLILFDGEDFGFLLVGSGSGRQSRRSAKKKEELHICDVFRAAFALVWGRLSETDRQAIRDHWKNPPVLYSSPRDASQPTPLIQVMEMSGSEIVCEREGLELQVPIACVVNHPERLPLKIAKVLARILRYSTGHHWALVIRMIEKPMRRWEDRRGSTINREWNNHYDELERKFLRTHFAETARLLSRWGFDVPSNPGNRSKTGR